MVLPLLNSTAQEMVTPASVGRFQPAVRLDGIFGNRRGVQGNDYSTSLFLPSHLAPNRNLVFAVLRGTANDASSYVANFGVGHRIYFEPLNSIFGSSFWYDLDKRRSLTYHRAGAQLEFFCRFVEFRSGLDIVLQGTKGSLVAPPAAAASPFFVGNNIALGFYTAATPYDQGYFEAGGPLPFLGRFGWSGYGGAYFLWADAADQTVGLQARLAAAVTRDFQIGARFTHDGEFGSNLSAGVVLTVPNGGLKQMVRSLKSVVADWSSPPSVVSRINNRVVRDYRVPVKRITTSKPALALDTQTHQPIVVLHVNPNATATGDGTVENPLRTLEAARLADNNSVQIIRVVPRNDGTGTNLAVTAPFQLLANQRLLSSSVQHNFATTRGTFRLPGFTGGDAPLLTNAMTTASSVVAMAGNGEVSGFTIDGAGTHVGLLGDIDGFSISRNTIQNATNGVKLSGVQGVGMIARNTFKDNLNDGVNISAAQGNKLDLTLSHNVGTGNGDDAVDITVIGTRLAITLTGNNFGGNSGDGIALTSKSDSSVVATVKGNRLGAIDSIQAGNGSAGFRFVADSGFASFVFGGPDANDGNVVLGNGGGELEFDLSETGTAIVSSQNNVMPEPALGNNSFDINVEFGSGFTDSQRSLFESAAGRWESIIIGDLPNIGSIDDVRIVAYASPIDGAGGTLAEATPLGLRAGSYLPFMGTMQFDSADLFSLEVSGELGDVIRHEIAHVLGFGTIWNEKGLVSGAGGNDPRYLGTQATAEYNARFGASDTGVPLENTGGEGTIDSHWRKSIFADELMTGSIESASQPISRITIGEFIDLGYTADISQADPY